MSSYTVLSDEVFSYLVFLLMFFLSFRGLV